MDTNRLAFVPTVEWYNADKATPEQRAAARTLDADPKAVRRMLGLDAFADALGKVNDRLDEIEQKDGCPHHAVGTICIDMSRIQVIRKEGNNQ